MNKKIKLFATQIPYEEEVLEENEVYVEFEVEELLGNIDLEDICEFVKRHGYKHEDDFESDLDDFDNDELWTRLSNSWSFNALEEIDDDDMIDYLEGKGYELSDNGIDSYDYVDSCLFDEISTIFDSLSCQKRQELRDLIINFR